MHSKNSGRLDWTTPFCVTSTFVYFCHVSCRSLEPYPTPNQLPRGLEQSLVQNTVNKQPPFVSLGFPWFILASLKGGEVNEGVRHKTSTCPAERHHQNLGTISKSPTYYLYLSQKLSCLTFMNLHEHHKPYFHLSIFATLYKSVPSLP